MSRKQFTIKKRLSETRAYRNFALGLFSFLVAFLIVSTFAPVHNSDASTVHITNNTSDYYIDITSADSLNLSVDAIPTGQLASANDTINIKTNSPSGYTLYVSTSTNDNNIYQDGSSSTASSGYFYPTTGTISSPVALAQNTWGFALDKSSGTTYSANFADISNYATGTDIPTSSSTWAKVPTVVDPTLIGNNDQENLSSDGDNYKIYYAVNANTNLPDGTYSTEITYTAISEGVNKFPTMQNFTAEQCDNMATDTSINLSDARDDKYYRVTKMKDGHCWMTDNLALDGTDKAGNVRILTPSDSNVTTNRPLAANIENGTASEYDVVQIYSGVANDVTSECNPDYPYCVVNTSTKYGNLYNWNAATAGVGKQTTTGAVTESICPKGWKLPDNDGDFSYANLLSSYSLPTSNVINGEASKKTQQQPLYFPLNGYYNSMAHIQGLHANLWMRTVVGSATSNAYVFFFNTSDAPGYSPHRSDNNKSLGFAVRCVFTGQSDEIMQNFTAAQCSALAESTTTADNRKTIIDSRDGKFYKISKLADGNCWMVSNLALDGMDGLGAVRTLTSTDSDVGADTILAANITLGTTTSSTVVQIYSGLADKSLINPNMADTPYAIVNGIKYGNMYNWFAATAKTGTADMVSTSASNLTNAPYSVCPKGWNLPTAEGKYSWQRLLSHYNYLPTIRPYSEATSMDQVAVNDGAAVQAMQKSPFWLTASGFYNGAEANVGRWAYVRTSTAQWPETYYHNSTVFPERSPSMHINLNNGLLYPADFAAPNKLMGSPVRCMLRTN